MSNPGAFAALWHEACCFACSWGGKCIFFFFYKFIYLFILAVLGLHFCVRAFSSCSKWGSLFIAVRGPLTVAASFVAEHRLQTRRLSSCGSRAQSLYGMWDLPRPGLEPVSPALAGRFPTTAPPGKPGKMYFKIRKVSRNKQQLLPASFSVGITVLWFIFPSHLSVKSGKKCM